MLLISDILVWGFSIFNIFGTLLNINKVPASYLIWSLCNVFWLVLDVYNGVFSRACLDVANLTTSVAGFLVWSRKYKQKKK